MPNYKNTDNLAASGDSFSIPLTKGKTAGVAVQTLHTNAAGAVVVLEASLDGENFTGISMIKPSDATAVISLTGADQFGVVPLNIAGFSELRVRRTDSAGGSCGALVGVQDN